MRLFLVFAISFTFTLFSFGQIIEDQYRKTEKELPVWVTLMYADEADPGLVQKAFEAYYKTHPFIKNGHTQYYKRWMRSFSRNLAPLPSASKIEKATYQKNLKQYLDNSLTNNKLIPNSWNSLGPYDFDKEAEGVSYAAGAAHVYTVEKSTSNPDVIYAGTATTGVWKSTNNGLTWSLKTRNLIIGSVLSVEIDFTDPNIAYFGASGSLFKTIDGGNNWLEIGDAAFLAESHTIRDIVSLSSNHLSLMLASDKGLYRSIDGGNNWSQIEGGIWQEIEEHPTQDSVFYAIKQIGDQTEFYKSNDGGLTFTQYTSGWPSPASGDEQKRTEIAVSPDDPDRVYALATGAANGGSGLYGVYISYNKGHTWARTCCGPQPAGVPNATTNQNLMAWSDDGSDDGGQYYYDLALAVSPTNADSVLVAGVNLWYSADGGTSFNCPSKWSHSYKANYVHADIHDVRFFGNELWIACDGGIFRSVDGGNIVDRRMFGIEGTDFWGFGTGFWEGEVMLGGTYHNGTLLKDNNVYNGGWLSTRGGDNYRGFVNFGDPRMVYDDGGGRILSGDRTESFSSFTFVKKPNASYTVGRSSNIEFDPRCYNTIYMGEGTSVWKSEDNGSTFNQLHDFGEEVTTVKVSWKNPEYIYLCTYEGWWDTKKIYQSINGGATFTDITPSSAELNGNTWVPYDLTLDPTDENILWIVRTSQYGSSPNMDDHLVYKSIDGGSNWINITTSMLDGEYPTNIVHQKGSDGGVYIGTRRAVYYRNDTMSNWALYNNNLPLATTSTKLVPYYRKGLIRNGTNRSVFEAPLYEDSPPLAQIAADRLNSFCTRDTIYYSDHSSLRESSSTWSWSFPGGTPSSSNERNPKVTYNSPGTYNVSLTVTDIFGSDSQTLNNFITITGECDPETVPGNALQCTDPGDYASTPVLNWKTNTVSFSAWIKPDGIQNNYAGVIMNDATAGGLNFREGNNTLGYHWPGGSWSWDSNLEVPSNEWSHVAMVVSPDSVILYLNGEKAVHSTSIDSLDIEELLIGSYKGWNSRNFEGLIDEVCIFNEALTTQDIRAYRHLSKSPTTNPSLVHYYQFNRASGLITDRIGIQHARLVGLASRTSSTAPIGGGNSFALNVNSGGLYDFTSTGISIEFPATGTYPNGQIFVSRLNLEPDHLPSTDPHSNAYWIINNYGNNATFSTLEEISFEDFGNISVPDATVPSFFKMYKRESNEDGDTWGAIQDDGDIAIPGPSGIVRFNTDNNITSFSQFIIFNDDGTSLPTDLITFKAEAYDTKSVWLSWEIEDDSKDGTFYVERSNDGIQFERKDHIGYLTQEQGLKKYGLFDHQPLSGKNYYRLVWEKTTNETLISQIKVVTFKAKENAFGIYPNPIREDGLIYINNPENEAIELSLFSMNGKLIATFTEISDNKLNLNPHPAGIYIYTLKSKTQIKNGRLVKAK